MYQEDGPKKEPVRVTIPEKSNKNVIIRIIKISKIQNKF